MPRAPSRARRSSRGRAPPRVTSAGTRATISPSYMTRIAVGERQDLLELERDEQDRPPSSRSSTSRRWTNSIAPTSSPRVGWAAIRTLRIAVDLPREDDLLLVPAGERACLASRDLPPRTSNSRMQLPRALDRDVPGRASRTASPAASRKSCSAMFSASVKSSTSPRRWRSSGMWPRPASKCSRRAVARDVLARRARSSRLRPPQAGDRVDRARSGRCRRRRRCRRSRPRGPRARRRAPSRGRGRRGRAGPRPRAAARPASAGALLDPKQHLAPDHQPREALLGRALARAASRSTLPRRSTRDPVGDLEHLVQLVADEDDRHPLALEAREDREELARLLRRQHGGRLVEDEDVRACGRAPSGSRRAAAGRR